jgi:ABC-type lipoprotein release transport system permease subunit
LNPLSPFTYYRRHKRGTLMLTGLLTLAVTGLYLLVGLMHGTYVAPMYTYSRHLRKFSLVQPAGTGTLDPAVVAQIRTHPDVAQVLPQYNVIILTTSVGGTFAPCRLMGLQEEDMAKVLSHSGIVLVEGQLPQPRTNGVALSQEVAAALDLEIGYTTDSTEDTLAYESIASPLEVVGILSGDVQLGVVSYEYLESHERYRDLANHGVLVTARPGREVAVDNFLEETIRSAHIDIHTYRRVMEDTVRFQMNVNIMLIPVVLLVTVAITAVVSSANRLALIRRLPEFGTLHAVGRDKGWLIRRLTLETIGLAVTGWIIGILAALGAMALLSATVYAPQGFAYDPIQASAFLLVTLLPLGVVGGTILTAARALGRLDTVAIIERGELSLEKARPGHTALGRARQHPRPLASTTFYRRHMRRAVALIGTMTLMIMGTALLIFIFSVSVNVLRQPPLTPLKPLSMISPRGLTLDPTVIAQVRAHPAVERTIPAYILTPLDVSIPLLLPHYPVEAYGVTAEDMAYLIDLYELQLAEGQLPRPNTNEIVIPWTIAQNRGIRVGDVIGDRNNPAYPGAPALPSTLAVSGIFAPTGDSTAENWLSFVSQEHLDAYQDRWRNELSLIVVAKAGQREALDTWLESELIHDRRRVLTYGEQRDMWEERWRTALFTFLLMESVIALVAAIALAGLNIIFVAQRQAEFGVLNALGLNYLQLVWRVAREALFTTGAAWILGVVVCGIVLIGLQHGVYLPLGLRIDYFNPTPWFFTLPVPVAVFAASTGTVAWALSRLDPVAIIERR